MTTVWERQAQLTDRDPWIVQMVHGYNGCTTEQIHARYCRSGSHMVARHSRGH